MSGNDRIGDAGETAMVEVYVGPADFTRHHFEDRSALLGPRLLEATPLQCPARTRHNDGLDGHRAITVSRGFSATPEGYDPPTSWIPVGF
jgi:hypothetical protein